MTVNERFEHQGKEIGDLRTEVRSRRVPWPTVGSFALACFALVVTLIDKIG